MHYLYFAGIGFMVGLVARILMPGRDPMGFVMTTILGVAGAYIGGLGANYFEITPQGSWPAFGLAVVGAFLLLAIIKFVRNV